MSSHRDIVRSLKQKDSGKNKSEETGTVENEDKDEDEEEDDEEREKATRVVKLTAETKKIDVLAGDFLKKRVDEIRSSGVVVSSGGKPAKARIPTLQPGAKLKQQQQQQQQSKGPQLRPFSSKDFDFELEIVVGESTTSRKLMDVTNGETGGSQPSLSMKRKRVEEKNDDDDDRLVDLDADDDERGKKSRASSKDEDDDDKQD